EERRQESIKQGVTNRAQAWTIGHYTADFVREESQALLRNFGAAGFRLEEGKNPGSSTEAERRAA
ncbi:MAG: hypothetical protein PHU43_10665, partial [Candidatus Bipolaricaulis sp.]|nr:hypothetical protein [Candidatus Bipolaricaulis sp.]